MHTYKTLRDASTPLIYTDLHSIIEHLKAFEARLNTVNLVDGYFIIVTENPIPAEQLLHLYLEDISNGDNPN